RESKNVAHVVVDDQHLLPDQHLVGLVQFKQQLARGLGELSDIAVQEESAEIEQTVFGAYAAHLARPGQTLPCPLVVGVFAVAIDDNRQTGQQSLGTPSRVGH